MPGPAAVGVGDAIRLWHKEACKLVQSNQAFGPRYLRDGGVWANKSSSLSPEELINPFNVFTLADQSRICTGLFTGP